MELTPHQRELKEFADDVNSKAKIEDKYAPPLTPGEGALVAAMCSKYISYYWTTKVFVKREPHSDERGNDIYGNPLVVPYIRHRLRNEAAVLRFLRDRTTIPVPDCLGVWEEHGLTYLKTAMVPDIVELRHVPEDRLPAAVARVTEQLESDILPQLRRLRRHTIGSPDPDLPVVPPRRVWDWKGTRVFPNRVEGVDEYVFCHTDLDRQNILVDPETFAIRAIIDWETAGFFPAEWELPFWKGNTREERHQMWMDVKERDLAMVGFGPKRKKKGARKGPQEKAREGAGEGA